MSPSTSEPRRPELRFTSGPLAAETTLLRDIDEHLEGGAERWARPLLLVVPSRTLRDHIQARLVAHRGAVVGLRAATLFGVALELTEDLAGTLLAGGDLFPIFARRHGRREPHLARALAPLTDGYAALLGPVRDLLDAGFEPALAEGLLEALAGEGTAVASSREVRRAEALVRVAARTHEDLAAAGAGRRSTLLAAAAGRVRERGPAALAAGQVWVYGFADASGVARDLIEALLGSFGGRLYLDCPPDPADRARPDAGVVFTRRFRERLQAMAPDETADEEPAAPPPRLELFRALGSDGEVREVGRRVRDLIDQGARPEGIAVVARQLAPYAGALRRHFASLGLPYSTYGSLAAKDRLGRRAEALADLLERGADLSVERWLELVEGRFGERPHADLRTGLATLGVGRLREAAALAADPYRREHRLRLPVCQGFDGSPDEDGEPRAPRLRHRYLPAAALTAATDAAAGLVGHLESWREAATLGGHLEAFAALTRDHLAWQEDAASGAIRAAGREVWAPLDPRFELAHEEFTATVAARLRELGGRPLGGEGGGVQVLDVVEARGITSEHLFLIGLNRGLFPRLVTEDPLFPDALRGVVSRQGAGVLPDLPDKLAGFDEERFLFAQLMASSPSITLSWQDTDDDQNPLSPSPLLERLRWVSPDTTWRHPPLARAVVAQRDAVPRSPLENGIAVALEAPRSRLAEVLPLLLSAVRPGAEPVAAARMAALDELDPRLDSAAGRATRQRLGPYFGLLGGAGPGDPRAEQALFVTRLEQLIACPWQLVLQRLLGLQPVPDPLAALPGITGLLIGALVHDVLEEVAVRAVPDPPADLVEARQRIPRPAPWPEPKELDALVYRRAEALCRREGISVDGFARMLAQAVAPHLEIARRIDWTAGHEPHVLGAEIGGWVEIEGRGGNARRIHFRADRLDVAATGLLLTDYKTGGKAVSTAKQDRARRAHLVGSVARGARLQGVAYALAAGQPGDAGRYLFVGPEVSEDESLRDVRISPEDGELADAFRLAAGAAVAAWDLGVLVPRLVLPHRDQEPARCGYCEVRDACPRGDSGARRRLGEWAESLHQRFTAGARLASQELSFLTLWQLPAGDRR